MPQKTVQPGEPPAIDLEPMPASPPLRRKAPPPKEIREFQRDKRILVVDDYSYVLCKSAKVNVYTENGINRFVLDRGEGDPRGLGAIRLLNDLGVAGPNIVCDPHDRFGVL